MSTLAEDATIDGARSDARAFQEQFLTVDEFLDNSYYASKLNLGYVHFFLSHARKSAVEKSLHGPWMRQFKLFVDYEGRTWRVTGASRLGDIWLTSRFDQEMGYERRVDLVLNRFMNWRDKADFELSWPQRWQLGVAQYKVDGQIGSVPSKANRFVRMLNGAGVPKRLSEVPIEYRHIVLAPQH